MPAGGVVFVSPADIGTPTRTHRGGRDGEGGRKRPAPITADTVQSTMYLLVSDAILYTDSELSPLRALADRYYKGEPFGNEEDGRSQFVMTVFRDTVNRIMPSLMTVFFGGERPCEFAPRQEAQIEAAEQITEYINEIVIKQDNNGFETLYTWFKDALIKRIGIVTWKFDESEYTRDYAGTALEAEQVAMLRADDEVEITDLAVSEIDLSLYDVEYTRRRSEGMLRFETMPPEELLFTRGARRLRADDPLSGTALFVGRRTQLTRAQLRAMGVEEDVIDEFAFRDASLDHNVEEIERQGIVKPEVQEMGPEETRKALWIEGYPYLDLKGDGSVQLCKVNMLGPTYHVVGDPEPIDDRPFAILCPDPEPHVIIGLGLNDQTMDLQKYMSMVVRSMSDSLALAIHPRQEYVEGEVSVEDIMNTEIGAPIRAREPGMVREVAHTFVGKEALPVLEFMEHVLENRVGVSSASAELDPSSMQSTTALAVQAAQMAALQKTHLIARIFAETGVRELYYGLLRELVRHPPRKRIVRMRGTYVEMMPDAWNADLDFRVNIPLGGGMKQERIAVLQGALAEQKQIMAILGPDNPVVNLKRYRDTLVKALKAAGRMDAEEIFGDVPQGYKPPPPPPNPEMMKAQSEGQLSQAKAQAEGQRAQSEVQKRQAEIAAEQQRLEIEEQKIAADIQLRREEMHLKDERERDAEEAKIAADLRKIELDHQLQIALEREKAALARQQAETENELARHKATAEAARAWGGRELELEHDEKTGKLKRVKIKEEREG